MMWTDSRDDVATLMDVPMMEAMESRLYLSFDLYLVKGMATYVDSDGDRVTVKLSGGGSGYITFDGEAPVGDASSINIVANPNGKSKLTITVKGQKDAGTSLMDGLTVVGSLASFKAPSTRLGGTVTMGVSNGTSIVVGSLIGSTMTLSGAPRKAISVKVGVMSGASTLVAAGIDMSLKIGQINAGNTVRANAFTKIAVDDRLAGTITADGANHKGVAIGSITAKKEVTGTILATGGSVGNISVKGSLNATITVGNAIKGITAMDVTGGVISADSLGKLVTKGKKGNVKKGIPFNAGDMNATVTLAGANVLDKQRALGSASIKGTLGGDLYVTGDAGTIKLKNLLANLTVTGKATVKTTDVLAAAKPDAWMGEIHLGSGSVKFGKTTFKSSDPIDRYVERLSPI